MNIKQLQMGGGNTTAPNPAADARRRYFGLDVIRIFASLFTIAAHFIGFNTHFNEAIGFADPSLFLQGMGRMFFKGTPFFMLMSGFLLIGKPLDRQFYRRGRRVIIAYLFFSVVTIFFKMYYMGVDTTLWGAVHGILSFNAIPYAWYIEMWIGLFLLAPFANILFRAISRRQQQLLIGTLFCLTAVPNLTNRYGLHLFPAFWSDCYPLLYYFIGAYIKLHTPRIDWRWAVPVVVAICAINPLLTAIFAPQHTLIQIAGGATSEAFSVIVGTLVFLLLYRYDIRNQALKSMASHAANLTLSVYLVSWIFDQLWYPFFLSRFYVNQSQFGPWFFIVVPTVFLSALLAAQVKEWLFRLPDLVRFCFSRR